MAEYHGGRKREPAPHPFESTAARASVMDYTDCLPRDLQLLNLGKHCCQRPVVHVAPDCKDRRSDGTKLIECAEVGDVAGVDDEIGPGDEVEAPLREERSSV